jgi:hypothetical protein
MDVSIIVCAFFCVCVQVEALLRAELITRPRSPTDCLRLRKKTEVKTESFMEVGQGPLGL